MRAVIAGDLERMMRTLLSRFARSRLRLLVGTTVVVVAVTAVNALGSSAGTISTIAGGGTSSSLGDGGPATSAVLGQNTFGVAADAAGNVYTADGMFNRVRRIDPSGTITTFAGTGGGPSSLGNGDGGPADLATIIQPFDVAVDGQGNVYITEGSDVRKVSPAGTITTIAGTGISGVAVDAQGNVYIADSLNGRVRKVTPSGTMTTIAGTSNNGIPFSGDGGPATSAHLNVPQGVAVDAKGNVYVSDTRNNRVRIVTPSGTITTFAGGGSTGTLDNNYGDGGPASSATLSEPEGLAVDTTGDLFIADTGDARVRMVNPSGVITTVAGSGGGGYGGDGGPATSALLLGPYSVALDSRGNLYIADAGNRRVREVLAPFNKTSPTTPSAPTKPTLILKAPSPQRPVTRKYVGVTVACNQACAVSATGVVAILHTHISLPLQRATARLHSAGSAQLRLQLSRALRTTLKAHLKRGQHCRATITVTATYGAGQRRTETRRVIVR
jgi:hypothetical protein